MTQNIRNVLATTAGAIGFAIGYFLTAPVLKMLMKALAGDPQIYQEISRDFNNSPLLTIAGIMIGLLLFIWLRRWSFELLGQYGLPGLYGPPGEGVPEVKISLRIHANRVDQDGNPERIELFSHAVPAKDLLNFMHGGRDAKLWLRNKDGLYLMLGKCSPSPYAEGHHEDNALVVKIRTRNRILHNFESVYGAQPTFSVQEGKPIAYYKHSLDYVGSETESRVTLTASGDRRVMEHIFLSEPPAQELSTQTA